MSPKEVIHDPPQELLQCTDLNEDGVIDYEEFLGATVRVDAGLDFRIWILEQWAGDSQRARWAREDNASS